MASKKTTKAAPKSKAPSKKTPTKPAVNKSAFIREHAKLPPQEIVKLAKSKGIELSIGMVYTLQSELRKKQGQAASKATKVKTTPAASQKAPSSPKGIEATFVSSILELGATRAQQLFESTLARVRALAK